MLEFAIKINDKYFKEFEYKQGKSNGRYGGNTYLSTLTASGDITGLELTEDITDGKMAAVGVGGKIQTIVNLMRYGDIEPKEISIVPVERVR